MERCNCDRCRFGYRKGRRGRFEVRRWGMGTREM